MSTAMIATSFRVSPMGDVPGNAVSAFANCGRAVAHRPC